MRIVLLGSPGPEKVLRPARLKPSTTYLIFLQEIYSETT